jgi:hypothetical protein
LGYKKKEIKAHTDRELQSLWASYTPEELLYKFFLWSMGREQEVAHTAVSVSDLNFFDNAVPICPKPHRNYRLKSKRNRNANVGDRYFPIHASLMARLGRGGSWKMYKIEQLSRVLLGMLSQVKGVAMG